MIGIWPACGLLLRISVGAVFVTAGIGKWGSVSVPQKYVLSVFTLEHPFATELIHLLPPLELAVGILLLLGCWTRLNAAISLSMLLAFCAVLITGWAKGIPLTECGCFSLEDGRISYPWILGRNTALILALLPAMIWGGGRLSCDSITARASTPGSRHSRWVPVLWALPVLLAASISTVLANQPPPDSAWPDNEVRLKVQDSEGHPVASFEVTDSWDREISTEDESGWARFDIGACAREFWVIGTVRSGQRIRKRVLLPTVEGVGGKTYYRFTIRLR